VVDKKGNAYAWGQNFDKQLGLYEKANKMLGPGTCVEGVMMVPKFLAFSLSHRVQVMACGARFTAAITKNGDLWTWGAGECGQLGTGRCTARENPQICEVMSNSGKKALMVGAACGNAHLLASSRDGELFSWGLNCKGQLGLGDITSRYAPVQVIGAFAAKKVFALGHSSAFVDRDGVLFTWGSNTAGRLMQEVNDSYLWLPTPVTKFDNNIIHSFAFCEKHSAALIITRLLQVTPDQCPQKSVNTLQLRGCGYYKTDTIIVKFMKVGNLGFQAPRSSVGTLESTGEITCKPPKFNEPGEYDVSIAINGQDFTTDAVRILVYADPVLGSFYPFIVDMRNCDEPVSIILSGTYLDTLGEDAPFRIRFSSYGHMSSAVKGAAYVEADAMLMPAESRSDEQRDGRGMNEEDLEEEVRDTFGTEREDEDEDNMSQMEEPPRERRLKCSVNLSPMWQSIDDQSEQTGGTSLSEPPSLCFLQAQLSLNANDLSKASSTHLICHRFTPMSAEPACISCDTGGRVTVTGIGFFASTVYKVQVVITESASGLKTMVGCTYHSKCSLFFDAPSIDSVIHDDLDPNDPRGVIRTDLTFCYTSPSGEGGELEQVFLHPGSIPLYYFNIPRASVHPTAIRRLGGTSLTIRLQDDISFPFHTSRAKVIFIQESTVPIDPVYVSAEMVPIKPVESSTVIETKTEGESDTRPTTSQSNARTGSPLVEETKAESLEAGSPEEEEGTVGELESVEEKQEMYEICCECPSLIPKEETVKEIMSLAIVTAEATAAAAAAATPTPVTPATAPTKGLDKKAASSKTRAPSIAAALGPTQPTLASALPKEVLVGILLDGVSEPGIENCTKIVLFDKVTFKDIQAQPKMGFAFGATVTVNVEGLVPTDSCHVRIRGANDTSLCVEATAAINELNPNFGTVVFQLSKPLTGVVDPEMKSRVAWYYLDISIDGMCTFDKSETPVLAVKPH